MYVPILLLKLVIAVLVHIFCVQWVALWSLGQQIVFIYLFIYSVFAVSGTFRSGTRRSHGFKALQNRGRKSTYTKNEHGVPISAAAEEREVGSAFVDECFCQLQSGYLS